MVTDNDGHQTSPEQVDIYRDDENDAIWHLRRAITSGENWFVALLQAIRLWTITEESHSGHRYNYIIDDEAFDYPLLVERLCHSVDGLIPEKERTDLLFFDKPPIELEADEFRSLIGDAKYCAYLNYLYGVIVEDALLVAVENEIDKERLALASYRTGCVVEEAYRRIYGASKTELLGRFRGDRGCRSDRSVILTEEKEFTYWRFKYRLRCCDKEKIASDTQKGLRQLSNQYAARLATWESARDVSSMPL